MAARLAVFSILPLMAASAVVLLNGSLDPENAVPEYQRKAAAEDACQAAAVEISSLRLQARLKFVDDCSPPKVTTVVDHPGQLIVTRIVEEQVVGHGARRKTFSVLMDGGGRRWQMLRAEATPN